MNISKSMLAGKNAAHEWGVIFRWVGFGLIVWFIAIPVAYLHRPEMGLDVWASIQDNDDIDADAFEMAYVDQLRRIRTRSAWMGLLLWVVILLIFPAAFI